MDSSPPSPSRDSPESDPVWSGEFGRLKLRGSAPLIVLIFEFSLSLIVLGGSGAIIVLHLDTAIDSAAVAVVSTVVGYWFGRAVGRLPERQ